MNTAIEKISHNKMFGGQQIRVSHYAASLQCSMRFSVYLPPAAEAGKVPAVYWLSGLTCTDENFSTKAGAQRVAAELGIALIIPDTSPRGDDVPDDDAYDMGQGAGFYLNATQAPWNKNYQMYDYITKELPPLVETNFPVTAQKAISGHSMGGHGAITIAIKNPASFTSVSALAPIANPANCAWGQKVFTAYLGDDKAAWAEYDSIALLEKKGLTLPLLVDQGKADEFLKEQLRTETLIEKTQHLPNVRVRYQDGYDHSYYFIASFIEEHLRFHAKHLQA